MKKLFSVFLLTMISLVLFIAPASASPKSKTPFPTEGLMSSDPMQGSSDSSLINSNQATATGGLIMKSATTIANAGNGTVRIYGYTQTYSTVSSVKVTVYLQKWNGTQWVDVLGVSNSATSATYVSATKEISVSSGYYYRSRAVHTATNGTTETTSTTATYIYM